MDPATSSPLEHFDRADPSIVATRYWHRLDDGHASFGGGAGFRYLLATRLGLGTGVDLAMGTGGSSPSIYFQIGSAWR